MGLSEWDLFYIDGLHRKFLSGHHTLFIPNIPKFHYSIGYRSENIAFAGIAFWPGKLFANPIQQRDERHSANKTHTENPKQKRRTSYER